MRYKWWLLTLASITAVEGQVSTGSDGTYALTITDSSANGSVNRYVLAHDSLVVTALSDYGRTPVEYVRRALTESESDSIRDFLSAFPFDSLEDAYIIPPGATGEGQPGPSTYRSVTLYGRSGERAFSTKMHGCYASKVVSICERVNRILPPEAIIRLRPEDYKTHME